MKNSIEKLEDLHNLELSENLRLAFNVTKLSNLKDGKNRKNYKNSALATLGDSLIKFLLTEYLFSVSDKGIITKTKSDLENNNKFEEIIKEKKLYILLYNDNGVKFHNQKQENKLIKDFATLFEAIIAAIYLDFDLPVARDCLFESLNLCVND